jgi:hypothetical protein
MPIAALGVAIGKFVLTSPILLSVCGAVVFAMSADGAAVTVAVANGGAYQQNGVVEVSPVALAHARTRVRN